MSTADILALLFRPVNAVTAVTLAFAFGVGYAMFMFRLDFLIPGSRYWQLPEGLMGGLVDMRMILSGYYWFIQDAWRWPLLDIAQVNRPIGGNAALMDVVPVLALACKLARGLFGVFNPYPVWVVGCFGLNAAALAALVRGLGQRSLLAACAAGALGAMSPMVHQRLGHLALGAHWTFVFALAAYASWSAGRLGGWAAGCILVLLSMLAFSTTIYLYVMAGAIAVAFFMQGAVERRLPWTGALAGLACVLGAAALPMWSFGLLGRQDIAVETVPFGYASMNMVAPFWPASSGIFAGSGIHALTRGSIGATPGQYDAYSYVGGGVLVLLLACAFSLALQARSAWASAMTALRRHAFLAAALLVLTLWSLSNTVYAGPVLVASYPLPKALLTTVLAWFRFEGRFFWPVVWLLCGCGVAGGLKLFQRGPALTLVAAALLLQWVDLSVWRDRVAVLVQKPPISAFGSMEASAAIEDEVRRLGAARILPAVHCTAVQGQIDLLPVVAGLELQLMAGRQNADMPSILAARNSVDCAAERATPMRTLAGRGLVLVLEQPEGFDMRAKALQELSCRETRPGLICTAR